MLEEIIFDTIDSLRDYIPRLKDSTVKLAESLQGGDQYEAMQQLPLLFEGMDWVVSAVNGIIKNGYQLGIDSSQLNEHLYEIENAIQNQDFVLLADMLEYEVAPILEEWLNKCLSFSE